MKVSLVCFSLSFVLWNQFFFNFCLAGAGENVDAHKHFPPEHYDKTESGMHDGPQKINITIFIEHIKYIDVVAMEYSVHGYLLQEWNDARLNNSVSHETILTNRDTIWLPDTYCLSCSESTFNDASNGNVLIRVSPNGDIFYSQLGQLTASCYMDLIDFPFDHQVCPLNISSYAFNNKYIDYHWKSKPVIEEMKLAQFLISDKVTSYTEVHEYQAGNFTVLSFEVNFTRQMGFYILQVFTPCFVLVVLSWMIVFMEPSDVGDRLAIGVTLILSMIFLLGYINQSLPKLSYIKAVDLYVIVSLAMIVLAVLESVFVYWLIHKKKTKETEELSEMLAHSLRQASGSPLPPMLTPLLLPNQLPKTPIKTPTKTPTKTPNKRNRKATNEKTTNGKSHLYVELEDEKSRFNPRRLARKFKTNIRRKRPLKRGACSEDPEKGEDLVETDSEKNYQNKGFIQVVDVIAKITFPLSYILFNITFAYLYVKVGV